jgi:hypothetical protein
MRGVRKESFDMRKAIVGVAAAALLTVGFAGAAGAQTVGPVINGDDAWVFNPPAGGGNGYLVTVEGAPSSFLIVGGEAGLAVDFGPGGLDGAIVYTPGAGADAYAERVS